MNSAHAGVACGPAFAGPGVGGLTVYAKGPRVDERMGESREGLLFGAVEKIADYGCGSDTD